jgi:hypothetical protein
MLVVAAGCTGNPTPKTGVVVTGKVVKGGMPLAAERLPPGEFPAEIIFVPAAGGDAERQALLPDGTFKEDGAGKGIAPGKYKLAVLHYPQGRPADGLQGAFSEQNSPINIDIPADKSGGEHDLGTIELNDYSSAR